MDAPQGLEPQYLVPKTSVLPLDEGAIKLDPAEYSALHDIRYADTV